MRTFCVSIVNKLKLTSHYMASQYKGDVHLIDWRSKSMMYENNKTKIKNPFEEVRADAKKMFLLSSDMYI